MTCPLGNSEFCFPRTSMFSLDFVAGNIENLGKQYSLFPSGPVISNISLSERRVSTSGCRAWFAGYFPRLTWRAAWSQRNMAALAWLNALVLVFFMLDFTHGLYFHMGETEKKCFIEEIPDETMVIGEFSIKFDQENPIEWTGRRLFQF